MARPKGTRNKETEDRRRQMIDRMRARLGQRGAVRASWRDLAAAAEVSLATLTHHFGKRDAVVQAIIRANGEDGAGPLAVLAEPTGEFAASIRAALDHLAIGLRVGVGEIVAIGLIEGLRQPGVGEVFVDASLEPIIAAMAARLTRHQLRGEMRSVDPRIAAIQLVAPLLLADIHQSQLGGVAGHPLQMAKLVEQVADAFIRAHGVSTPINDGGRPTGDR